MPETHVANPLNRTDSLDATVLFIVGIVVVGSCVFAAGLRGVWYDENWSIFLSRHDLPLGRVISDRWLREINPPGSFLLGWLIAPMAGDSLLVYRLTNLVPAALLLVTLALMRRDRGSFSVMFGLLVFTNPWCVRYFAEFRSYFSQICCAGSVVAAAYFMYTSEHDLDWRDAVALAVPALAAVLLLNLHYIAAYLAVVLLSTLCLGLLLCRKPRFATAVFATAIVGLMIMVATYIAQREAISTEVGLFRVWNTTSNLKAFAILAEMVALAIGPNLGALWAAFRGYRKVFGPDERLSALRAFVCWAVVATAGMAAASLALNLIRPVLVERYLSVLVPVAMGPLAALCCVVSLGALRWLIVGNAAVLAISSGYKVAQQEKWLAGARFISGEVRQCHDTAVHTVPHWQLEPGPATILPNEIAMNRFAYERLGRLFNFRPEPEGSRRVSETCPTIIWAGHFYLAPPAPSFAATRVGLRTSAKSIAGARSFTLADGVMVVFPPAKGSHGSDRL